MNIDFGQNLIATKKLQMALGAATFVALSLASAATPPPTTKGSKSGNISGFFLGAELGTSATFQKVTTTEAGATTSTAQEDIFPIGNVGVKLGYTHFFNKWVGIRGYANYHYGFAYNTTTTTETNTTAESSLLASYHQVAGNVEATFKFFDLNGVGLGAYAGLGAGYGTANRSVTSTEANATTTTDTKVASGFVLPVNVGLEVYMGKHHNASLNFRIPTIASTLTTTNTGGQQGTTTKYEERNLIITLGYSYTF